jgi:hypothetical protein
MLPKGGRVQVPVAGLISNPSAVVLAHAEMQGWQGCICAGPTMQNSDLVLKKVRSLRSADPTISNYHRYGARCPPLTGTPRNGCQADTAWSTIPR